MTSIFDLHVHTHQGSPDSALTPEEMLDEAQRIGLTGVMVTEHNGWVKHDFDRWAQGDLKGIVVVRALEVYTPLGHIITMGLEQHRPLIAFASFQSVVSFLCRLINLLRQ